ncbi:uncharacterized protein LOC124271496 [Haliotis rubra]|uniref:uncharacterized protein LOC124271496 n=1 Tax=Haliotis rubra TaxID=36100 RepID=UPI001EE63369|nr:uncharacterized protein LOC124271496 [Haliotis rubra]
MASARTTQRASHVVSGMVVVLVLCWQECVTQHAHIAVQSSCKPENNSKATNTCIEQGMHILIINDLKLASRFAIEAEAKHGSIWISGYPEECKILKNGTFTAASCGEQHYYLCIRKATMEEELLKNDTRTWPIYVPCQRKETSVSPMSSTAPGMSETTATTNTTSRSDPRSKGLSTTAVYLIVAVAVCVIVVCVVAAVVIKRCTAKKEENVTLKNVDVVRQKNEGEALTENGGNNDDTPM